MDELLGCGAQRAATAQKRAAEDVCVEESRHKRQNWKQREAVLSHLLEGLRSLGVDRGGAAGWRIITKPQIQRDASSESALVEEEDSSAE